MFQKLTVVGNLGADPEMRYMPDGTAVTNFSLATNRKWKDQSGELAEETTWFRVSVFGRQAEACNEYLSRGRQVLVEGRLKPDERGGPRTFTRNDGTVGASFEVTANTVRFLQGGSEQASQPASSQASKPAASDEGDDIPF